MDLTAGFHQAPLSEFVKRWTVFTSAFGMFEWNRVPMGLGRCFSVLVLNGQSFFGVMDLTSGFQAPLSECPNRWTVFTSAFGMFEWNRDPMGLKGAPSHFQRMMMVHVLGDLLQKAMKVYLDDFVVFGVDEDEFIANVEAVFKRCLKAKFVKELDNIVSDAWSRLCKYTNGENVDDLSAAAGGGACEKLVSLELREVVEARMEREDFFPIVDVSVAFFSGALRDRGGVRYRSRDPRAAV